MHGARFGVREHEVTPERLFFERRGALQRVVQWPIGMAATVAHGTEAPSLHYALAGDVLCAEADVTGHNNYYEFSPDKKAVKTLAQALTTHPWTVSVEGEVEKPLTVDIDDVYKLFGAEERIYRLRCVEGWSMVVPWSGFALSKLLDRARPTSRAKFVEFESLHRSREMIGQRMSQLVWPYREGLRMDEAMHPLTFVVTGLYGKPLPKQNGAPLRMAVPWKYGFKSPKALTRIVLRETPPITSWNQAAPAEYGFFGNVNPAVAHPRWSQSRENRLGELHKRPTLPFNGYAAWVADLYRGMDPRLLY
ncbi:MAG: protein-methionine-sulfoxide reductase catalytic subunit MsrP [Rhodoferax sp.]|nr:protein-methionine-sulfoxide reductase catalytic subunit MsrP [Rhodoferax sp.]